MPLSQEQGEAIVATLRADTAAALARSLQVKSDAESGVIHGVLAWANLTADNAVDAVPGALRMQLGAVDSLSRSLPAAVADPGKGDSWLSLARNMQSNLAQYATYQESATVDAILAQTAAATAQQVKDGASAAAGFVLSALPWWAYAAAGVALVAVVLVYRAQARAVAAVAA